jgi:hypothetical protein
MPIRKEHKNRKLEQSENYSLGEELQSLEKVDLYNLVENLLEQKPELYKLVLEWFKQKQKTLQETGTNRASINDKLLMEYWRDAREIISEFNEYGGGFEEDEDEAYSRLGRISDLIEEGNISTAAKFEFLDDAFEEYNIDNSGLEDAMMDVFFEICKTKEEWEYLVKKLDEHPSDWRKKLIMDIQREHLHDDKAYLEERMKKLHYGMDYWDLVNFYIGKGDLSKALETAEQGILKGEGRLTELFQFLSDHFVKKGDAANLERVVRTALTRKHEEKPMLDRLFEYYKAQQNYKKAKEALLRSFESAGIKGYYAEYKRMREFLKDSDWEQIEPKVFNEIKNKNVRDYLRICLDKNMKNIVLEVILNPPKNKWGFVPENDFDEFADKIIKEYPDKIIEYYLQKAYRNIKGGNRKTYSNAAVYLAKVKNIYTNIIKDESKWEQRFSDLKSEFKNRPAFIDEVKHL